jgi:hypothetical protein
MVLEIWFRKNLKVNLLEPKAGYLINYWFDNLRKKNY